MSAPKPAGVSHPLFGSTMPKNAPADPVFAATQKILSVQNTKNRILCHVSLPLTLEALPYTSLDPQNGRFYRISRASLLGNYPEYSNYEGMWDTVVRIRLRGGRAVEVRDGERGWLSLPDFLAARLPKVKEYWAGPGSPQWRQALDWNTNGKAFALMDLPGEIRNMIYDYAACFCYPFEFEKGFNYVAAAGTDGLLYKEFGRHGSHVQAELYGRGRILNGAGPVMALLLTSKRVNAEFTARLWRNMEFRFQGAWPLRRFLDLTPKHRPFQTLSKVTIQMTTWNFVKYFGIWIHPSARPWGQPDAEILRGLQLQELELRLGHREDFTGYRLDTWLAPCCHRVLTGLILWAAKDYVKDVPVVTVEGCVPAGVKAAFLQLLEDERNGVESAITEWDIIGKSVQLAESGESWLVRTDTGLGCQLLDHQHSCADMGPCTDEFCLSEKNYTPATASSSSN